MRRWTSTGGSSRSNCGGGCRGWRSSTWATSSSPCRRAAPSRADRARHFGLVVDDKEAVRAALEDAGAEILPGRGLDFRDPWGNHVQVVSYGDIQFTKAPEVLGGMGLDDLEKTPAALRELRDKGLG